ncbi:hypothetical protein AAWM_02990 [Aspergillus awamori]|uniref:Uncharacterized protein n=1 Tax=Aspergillus awamori TaxID=105351 RepID=A0A401KLK9_ASPAW|nr:hypothetical protein AAWM_02990 [Aspergillus awamori]
MHRHLGPLTGVTGVAEEWKGTQDGCWRRGGRVRLRKRAQRASRRSPGRGIAGGPLFTLDHRTFARRSVAREGRWYYVEGERQLISAAGSPPTLLPCQAGHLSVTGGAQVLRGLASGTGVPAHPGPLVFLRAAGVFSGLRCSAPRLRVDWRSGVSHADAPVTPEISCRGDL